MKTKMNKVFVNFFNFFQSKINPSISDGFLGEISRNFGKFSGLWPERLLEVSAGPFIAGAGSGIDSIPN